MRTSPSYNSPRQLHKVSGSEPAGWLRPPDVDRGVRYYLEVVKDQLWVVILMVVLAAGGAALWASVASRTYEATADVRLTPVSAADPTLASLGLIRESNTPERAVETMSRVVVSPPVAERAARILKTDSSPEELLSRVKAAPVAQSDLIAITARASDGEDAARLANAFGQAVVLEGTERLHAQIDDLLPSLRRSIRDLSAAEQRAQTADSLPRRLSVLELLREGPDPTVRLEIRAGVPTSPVGPGLPLALAAGALIGLLLGLAAAFAIRSLDPTLRRESQLREHYRLPIFARIATQAGRHDDPLTPASLSAGAQEAYRSLRTLMFSRPGTRPQVMLITSPSPGDGKSTTALNLALSFAASAQSVLLIEADLRRPSLAGALGVDVPASLSDVLLGKVPFEDAVQTVEAYGPSVSFLLGDRKRPQVLEILGLAAVDDLLDEARERFDAVIIDSPPATAVADALPLAQKADAVLLVVRVGKTRLPALARLGELLAQHGITPVGLTVNGVDDVGTSSGYEYYARPAQSGATAT